MRKISLSCPEPGLESIEDIRGGLRELKCAARWVQLTHAEDALNLLVPDTVSVFQTAGACGLIPEEAATRLGEATCLWRNIRGALHMVVGNRLAEETLGLQVKTAIARACGSDDFHALPDMIREVAARASLDLAALEGLRPNESDMP